MKTAGSIAATARLYPAVVLRGAAAPEALIRVSPQTWGRVAAWFPSQHIYPLLDLANGLQLVPVRLLLLAWGIIFSTPSEGSLRYFNDARTGTAILGRVGCPSRM
jgi:hypothetical protein